MNQRAPYAIALACLAAGCSSNADAPDAAQALSDHRKAYVGLFGDQSIAVLDTVTKRVVKQIPVSAPDGLIVTPDGKKVYVSSTDTGSVKVITTADDSLTASIDVGAKPAGVSVTPDGSRVLVSVAGQNEAVLIDTSSDAVIEHVAVPAAHASCVSADGRYAYVGSQATDAPAIVKLDLSGHAPPTSFAVDKSPRMLSCTPTSIYFTAVGLDAIEAMDPLTGVLGTPIVSGGSPHDVRSTPDAKLELVVSQTAGDLELVDVAARAVTASIPTGKLAHWITLFNAGQSAYVTNEGDDNVVAVDLDGQRVTDTIPIGDGPRKMALQP
jgi:YVTN family beta-propeller protein